MAIMKETRRLMKLLRYMYICDNGCHSNLSGHFFCSVFFLFVFPAIM